MSPAELRQYRRALGWTQPVAAARLGVSTRAFKYYEDGKTSRGTPTDLVPKSVALAMIALRAARDLYLEAAIKIPEPDEEPVTIP